MQLISPTFKSASLYLGREMGRGANTKEAPRRPEQVREGAPKGWQKEEARGHTRGGKMRRGGAVRQGAWSASGGAGEKGGLHWRGGDWEQGGHEAQGVTHFFSKHLS